MLFDMRRQYAIELDAARARMAAAGLEGTGVEEGMLARMREDFMSRLTSETRTANSRALVNFYEIANRLELSNTQLLQDTMRRQAELDFEGQRLNQAMQSGMIDLETGRREQNALREQQARLYNQQVFFQAQVENARFASDAYQQEYRRREFNSEQGRVIQTAVGQWSFDSQRLMNEFGLRWGIEDMETLRKNAALLFDANAMSAGFDQESKELLYRTLASVNVTNAQEINDLVALTGNQQLSSYLGYLDAFSAAQGLNLNAILGVAAHERDLMQMLYGDNWQQNNFALQSFQMGIEQYLQLAVLLGNLGQFQISRQRSETSTGI